jgi:hypothetical protein
MLGQTEIHYPVLHMAATGGWWIMRNAPSQRLSLACLSRVLLGVSSFPTEYILRYLTLLSSRPACPLPCCSALSFVLSIYILSLAAISSLALLHIFIVTTVPCGTYYYSYLSTYAATCTSAYFRSFNRNRSPSAKPLSSEITPQRSQYT